MKTNKIFQNLNLDFFDKKKLSVCYLREDLNHPEASGNKFYKLKYNFEEAKKQNLKTILTIGGAYSNHIYATALFGKSENFKTIGIIRGEELGINEQDNLKKNSTLKIVKENGMRLYYLNRKDFRNFKKEPEKLKKILNIKTPNYFIPEGGTNDLAIKGTEEILNSETKKYDYIILPVGTGGTISGVIKSSLPQQKIVGILAVRDLENIKNTIEKYTNKKNYELISDYDFGGYAKFSEKLIEMINNMNQQNLPLDPIYNAKAFWGLCGLVKQDYFKPESKILMIHTGGLQAVDGFNLKYGNKIF